MARLKKQHSKFQTVDLYSKQFVKAAGTAMCLLVIGGATYGFANIHKSEHVVSADALCTVNSPVTVTSDTTYNAYFMRSNGWTGADGGNTALLPDGRVAWIFSDTWLNVSVQGTYPNRTRALANSYFVRNSTMLQSGTGDSFQTITGGTLFNFKSLVPDGPNGTWYWTNDPVVEGNYLRVPAYQMKAQGTGAFGFAETGIQGIATFTLPDMKFVSMTNLFTTTSVPVYGQSILEESDYDYMYTSETVGLAAYAHVARVPKGHITEASKWQFYTGSTWSSNPTQSGRVANMNPQAVVKRGNGYVMLGIPAFSNQLVASYGCSPTGPWSVPTPLYTIPEVKGTEYAYGVSAHPELDDASGRLLVTYDINNTDTSQAALSRVDTYRPKAVRLSIPPNPTSAPDLVVSSINTSPVNPAPGQAVTFSATLKNIGSTPTPAFANVGATFFVDEQKASWTVNHYGSIPAGASVTYTANGGPGSVTTWRATVGAHTIKAQVDENNLIYEPKANDSLTSSISVIDPLVSLINVGGGTYTGSTGDKWIADRYFSGGHTYATTAAIAGTGHRPIYQTERAGMTGYHIPVPNGTYTLGLDMAELYYSAAGKRVFSISAEGKPVVTDLDLYKSFGKNNADRVTATVTVTDGSLDLGFSAKTGEAKLDGIEIIPSSASSPTPTAVATPTATDSAKSISSTSSTLAAPTLTAPQNAAMTAINTVKARISGLLK